MKCLKTLRTISVNYINQFQPKTKIFVRKLELIRIKSYRQKVSLSFNQTCIYIDNSLNHKQSINLYNKKQFHSNYKIDEHVAATDGCYKHILKKPYPKKVLPTDPTKKDKRRIYDQISLGWLCIKENYTYVGLTTTTLSRRLTMQLYDSSSIV